MAIYQLFAWSTLLIPMVHADEDQSRCVNESHSSFGLGLSEKGLASMGIEQIFLASTQDSDRSGRSAQDQALLGSSVFSGERFYCRDAKVPFGAHARMVAERKKLTDQVCASSANFKLKAQCQKNVENIFDEAPFFNGRTGELRLGFVALGKTFDPSRRTLDAGTSFGSFVNASTPSYPKAYRERGTLSSGGTLSIPVVSQIATDGNEWDRLEIDPRASLDEQGEISVLAVRKNASSLELRCKASKLDPAVTNKN